MQNALATHPRIQQLQEPPPSSLPPSFIPSPSLPAQQPQQTNNNSNNTISSNNNNTSNSSRKRKNRKNAERTLRTRLSGVMQTRREYLFHRKKVRLDPSIPASSSSSSVYNSYTILIEHLLADRFFCDGENHHMNDDLNNSNDSHSSKQQQELCNCSIRSHSSSSNEEEIQLMNESQLSMAESELFDICRYHLPFDVMNHVFAYLKPIPDLFRLERVSKQFQRMVHCVLWRTEVLDLSGVELLSSSSNSTLPSLNHAVDNKSDHVESSSSSSNNNNNNSSSNCGGGNNKYMNYDMRSSGALSHYHYPDGHLIVPFLFSRLWRLRNVKTLNISPLMLSYLQTSIVSDNLWNAWTQKYGNGVNANPFPCVENMIVCGDGSTCCSWTCQSSEFISRFSSLFPKLPMLSFVSCSFNVNFFRLNPGLSSLMIQLMNCTGINVDSLPNTIAICPPGPKEERETDKV